jgi:hypothetical protein
VQSHTGLSPISVQSYSHSSLTHFSATLFTQFCHLPQCRATPVSHPSQCKAIHIALSPTSAHIYSHNSVTHLSAESSTPVSHPSQCKAIHIALLPTSVQIYSHNSVTHLTAESSTPVSHPSQCKAMRIARSPTSVYSYAHNPLTHVSAKLSKQIPHPHQQAFSSASVQSCPRINKGSSIFTRTEDPRQAHTSELRKCDLYKSGAIYPHKNFM